MGLQRNQNCLCWSHSFWHKISTHSFEWRLYFYCNLMIIKISIFHSNLSILVFRSLQAYFQNSYGNFSIIIYDNLSFSTSSSSSCPCIRVQKKFRQDECVLTWMEITRGMLYLKYQCMQENTLIIKAVEKHTVCKGMLCCAEFGISGTCTGENLLCFWGVK